jgi:hypothetical protein
MLDKLSDSRQCGNHSYRKTKAALLEYGWPEDFRREDFKREITGLTKEWEQEGLKEFEYQQTLRWIREGKFPAEAMPEAGVTDEMAKLAVKEE